MTGDEWLGQVLGYLHNSGFKNTNVAQHPDWYINPNSKIMLDNSINDAGQQPIRNQNITINPDAGSNSSQEGSLHTLMHEYSHTEQPALSNMFEFTNPLYRTLSSIDFPYYDGKNNAPGSEVLAELRAGDAMQNTGTNVWTSPMGKDVLQQLQAKGYPEDYSKQMLNSTMFPKLNFSGPVHQPTSQSYGLSNIFNSSNLIP